MICLDVDHVRSFVCVKLYSEHMLDREIRLLEWIGREEIHVIHEVLVIVLVILFGNWWP